MLLGMLDLVKFHEAKDVMCFSVARSVIFVQPNDPMLINPTDVEKTIKSRPYYN